MAKFKINPDVNTRSLMEKHLETIKIAESALVKQLIGDNNLDKMTLQTGEYYIQSAYTAIYQKLTNEIATQSRVLETIRPFYLTEVILNQITDDALAPMVGTEEIFKYSCKNPEAQKELDLLVERLELNQLVQNITPDLCFYGDYTLETEIDTERTVPANETLSGKEMKVPSRGLMDLKDKVDHGTVITLSQDGKQIGYLSRDKYNGKILFHHPSDFVKFTIGGSRVRVNLDTWLPEARIVGNKNLAQILDSIPRFLRIGKSVFFGITAKMRELELLEKLVPATKINKLSQGNIIGVNLPENYDLKDGMQASRELEGLINKKINVDPTTGEITAEAILSIAGRTRVIPVFGDKGELSKLDTKNDDADDLTSQTKELRELILDSIGVPSELIYKHEGDGSKNETLKRYSKYLRKLKRVQKAISEGLKQIAWIHLQNKGLKFDEKDIEVVFLNAQIEIDNLDKLEYAEATMNMLGNIKNFFGELASDDSPYREMVDLEKVAEYIDANLKLVGLADALKLKKEGGKGIVKPADPMADDGMGDDMGDDDMGAEDDMDGLEDDEAPMDDEPVDGEDEEEIPV